MGVIRIPSQMRLCLSTSQSFRLTFRAFCREMKGHIYRLRVESLARFVGQDGSAQHRPDPIDTYAQYMETPPVCIATSFECNFSNIILQACAHKKPRISETERAIDVKLGATLVVVLVHSTIQIFMKIAICLVLPDAVTYCTFRPNRDFPYIPYPHYSITAKLANFKALFLHITNLPFFTIGCAHTCTYILTTYNIAQLSTIHGRHSPPPKRPHSQPLQHFA